ncbi:hypothetical protein EU527_09715 [Candidatus Thorarchaeota archaeon]|nr:MAG: hypothetical protein EU527_09715 [Candidatus Thorarchaeota archaeon]
MNYHKDLMIAITVTIIAALVVAGTTENIRQYMEFSWEIDEGDKYVYEVTVFGHGKQGSVYIPLTQSVLNNTRILITIVTLPDIPLFINSKDFAKNVIEYLKTNVTYENGNLIPMTVYHEINTVASRCFMPRGSWSILDSFYPNSVNQPENATIASYISVQLQNYFYMGYISYNDNQVSGWFGEVSKDTGVPASLTVWAWGSIGTYEYCYNMTLTLAT